jgi:23S rRNA (adenine2503-C2)-methyltransferase
MSSRNLIGYNIKQFQGLLTEMGEKPFRGKQIYKWLYNTRQYDFAQMTDLTKQLRSQLDASCEIRLPKLAHRAVSRDGTEKFLYRLDDGSPIETVLIPEEDRTTVCLSSQSGCALGCKFCATGTMGLGRNLTVGEIVGQLMHLRDHCGEDVFTNVVFMGMGEPFNNYDNLVDALRIMSDPLALGIGAKKITVSTVGITPMILRFADSGLKAHLALSLHSAIQAKREQLIPVARKYPLEELMEAAKYYTTLRGQRIFIEYVLFRDLNDSQQDALALAKLIEGLPCKINLLAYNEVPGLPYRSPTPDKVDWFAKILYPRAPAVTVRKSRGSDIAAACGQLAAKEVD